MAFADGSPSAVRALAGIKELSQILIHPDDSTALKNANAVLDHFNLTLNVEVCYLMDPEGNTIASSNRHASDSFVGKNFGFSIRCDIVCCG